MKRLIESQLLHWKDNPSRKPLVLEGARQVGKTWIMREFGRKHYSQTYHFDFYQQPDLASLFVGSKNPAEIVQKLSFLVGGKINPDRDLILFDEIQECPDALNALKYFAEEAPEYHVISAGSLLGTFLAANHSYPVGKVNRLVLEPLSFDEFLCAVDSGLSEYYRTIERHTIIPEVFHRKLLDVLDAYLTVGGMPECVGAWLARRDPAEVDALQRDLIALYENDFAKHNAKLDAAKILLVYRAVVPQLAKANEKFIYGALRDGARARGYEEAIEWLVAARIVRRVRNVSTPDYPLNSYAQSNAFKLFLLDTGLLRRMAGVSAESMILGQTFPFKGPYLENFVLQQLVSASECCPHYFAPRSTSEIDFVLQLGDRIVPVEVKAGEDKSAPAFKAFVRDRQPAEAIRFSRRNLRQDGAFVNIPLYLASRAAELLR